MAPWQGAQALLPTKSAPRATDMAIKIKGNSRSTSGYDIVAMRLAGDAGEGSPAARCSGRAVAAAARPLSQQRLYFSPEPHA